MDDNEVDRISNLPDGLTHHILSFLDMKYVVQTSVLSRRWRYVWKTVSTLVFGVDAFGQTANSIEMIKFTRFIDNVLLLRGMSDIQKFHLYWEDNLFDTDTVRELLKNYLNTWILVALSRNVQDLLIRINHGADSDYGILKARFPHCLFNSQSLRKLVLDMTQKVESCVVLPKSMDLPMLKYLELSSFYTKDVGLVNKLISSCPVLESLVLRDINIDNGDDVDVSIESRELKHLEIISDRECLDPHYKMAKIIKLSTPNLISFFCSAYMLEEYCLENLSSLVTATIEMTRLEEGDLDLSVEEQSKVYRKRMMEFLRGFHNVKELTVLSPDFVQVLGGYPVSMAVRSPQLCNLRCLKLTTQLTQCCLRGIVYLLKTSPSLEYLFLTLGEPDLYNHVEIRIVESELSVPCLMSHLKHVEIRNVGYCEYDLKFLEFLLKNATVLEKMVVYLDTRASVGTTLLAAFVRELTEEFKNKLRTFPRASPCLTMVFL